MYNEMAKLLNTVQLINRVRKQLKTNRTIQTKIKTK